MNRSADRVSEGMAKQRLEEIPEAIEEKAEEVLEGEEPQLIARSDLNLEGYFEEDWLFVTDVRVVAFSPPDEEEQGAENVDYRSLPLEAIEEISLKRYVGNAFLEAKLIGGGSKDLIRFSLSYTQRFEWVSDKIEELQGEEGVEEDLESTTRERLAYEDRCPICGGRLPEGMDICPQCASKERLLSRMFQYLKPYWKQAGVALLLLLGLTVLNLAPPYITRLMIDSVFPNRNVTLFTVLIGSLIGVYVFRALFRGLRTYVMSWLGQRITLDLRSKVFSHIQKLNMNYYDKNRTGKIMNRVTTDTARVRRFLTQGLQQTLNHLFKVIGIVVILFTMNWQLALMALAPVPLVMFLTVVFANKIHKVFHRVWRRVSTMKAILGDTIPGVKVVKAFTKENEEIRKFDDQLEEVFSSRLDAAKARSFFRPAMTFSTALGALIIWIWGGYNVLMNTGLLTLGTLVAFVSYMWKFFNPIKALARLSGKFESAITSAERVFSVLDIEPEMELSSPSSQSGREVRGQVTFEDVSFQYEAGQESEVLSEINLEVEPGETIGLVGPTGAGKTTFVNLIPRFYDVKEGEIKLDGKNIKDFDLQFLRRKIGIVAQHPFLFYGTIADNISYGVDDVDREEIIKAAKLANAHEFIMESPLGYDSQVGERGVGLSGGERQRISIARAILKDAPIMILDEATSAVDTETEEKIQTAIDRLIEGRTTFVIAHRLSTLKNADRLIVLEDGRLVEQGTHEELLEKEDGLFKKLWEMQTTVSRI